MCMIAVLDASKETPNKLRWQHDVEGIGFKFYVPKWRVPDPWPKRIIVSMSELSAGPIAMHPPTRVGQPISTIVEKRGEHTETVKFTPLGDPEEWEIGEPYIPYRLLPSSAVRLLQIEVKWDRSSGEWPRFFQP